MRGHDLFWMVSGRRFFRSGGTALRVLRPWHNRISGLSAVPL